MDHNYCDNGLCLLDGSSIIEIKNLSFRYGNSYAFKNITMKISPCSVTAIIGPSGGGKSSLLVCLNRMNDFVKNGVLDGTIKFAGKDINDKSMNVLELRKKVGMIFQRPNPFPMSIENNITLPLKYHGMKSRKERQKTLEEVLREVGLWDEVKNRLKASALTLSGGQQQRLCIARAIALKPEVILMDEPCSALDPKSSIHIEKLILSMRKKFTVLVVTHNLAQARRISDHTVLLWSESGAGYIADQGPTSRVFSRPANTVASAYISGAVG